MEIKELSVFFPLLNEEGNVKEIVKKAIIVLDKLNLQYEILLIDDGSKDKTGEIAEQLAKQNPKIRAIHHRQNLGYGEALKSGFYNAKYDTICYTDGDGQFDFSELPKFLSSIIENDLVIGFRIKRRDPLFRILFNKGWKLSLFAFFGLTIKDVDCGFKIIRKKVLEKIPRLESTRGAMINAELAIKSKKAGFKIGQIGVNHYPRLSGKPTGASLKVITKSYLDLLTLWWKLKDEKHLFLILMLILFLALFLRLYRIDEYMTFLGDEGRDALIMKKILAGDLPFIGPPTSVGNIYLGPLYYYMMFIPMALTNLNPVSAAVMNAFIGVATVFLIYYLGKIWFGRVAGLIAAYLYTISPVTIIYSHSSWNPNPTPFFCLLSILGLYKAHSTKDYRWLILTGLSVAGALQMHYLALIMLPVLIWAWVKEIYLKKTAQIKPRFFWRGSILAIVAFFILMSPLLIFDLKHNFLNYRAISSLLSGRDSAIGLNIIDMPNKLRSIYSGNLVGRYMSAENPILTPLVSILILIPLIWAGYLLYKNRNNKEYGYQFWILNNWLLVGILGLTLYKQNIYDHYLGFLNPVSFLLLGSLVILPVKNKKILYGFLSVLIILLTIVNFQKSPLLNAPNNQLKKTQELAKFIITKSQDVDFNFALLAENNYDSAYQFYLEQYGSKPKQLPFEKTNQLFVICEDPCDPIYSSKHEIASFGWTKVEDIWNVEGVKIYRLIHNPEEIR